MQSFPHEPQFRLSFALLISQPSRLVFSVLQFSQPPSQLVMLHCPPVQLATPWFALHGVVHPPQVAVLLPVFVSQPSRLTFSFALQSLYPTLHAMLHAPAAQLGVPFALPHAALHPPQCAVLVPRFTSQPSPRSPLQLP